VPAGEPFRYYPIRVEVEGDAHCANIPDNFWYITDALKKTFAPNCSLKTRVFYGFLGTLNWQAPKYAAAAHWYDRLYSTQAEGSSEPREVLRSGYNLPALQS
jgi:hypothetical protein